jgi:drug/metabolite transporter (DMT)-like permease
MSPRYLMRTAVLLTLAVLSQGIGNVLLSHGMKALGPVTDLSVSHWPALALAVLASPWIWLGTAGLLGFVILFAITLSWADLSLVLPVASVEIMLNVGLAAWLLREPVSALDWAGTFIIAAGVALVAGTAREPAGERGREPAGASAPAGATP